MQSRVKQVLDHGHVRLIDHMGDDQRIIEAARVSYGKGTKSVRKDAALIDYLLRHGHTSPFEQVVFVFNLKMPIFVARQWMRHRTARLNEISGRYSIMEDAFYVPEPERVQGQSVVNRQNSDGVPLMHPAAFSKAIQIQQDQQYQSYEQALEMGVARELARINLPLATYTEIYWQMDLHNLFHLLRLRLDGHAQWEVRQYAAAVAAFVKEVVPIAYAAFENHVLKATRFSDDEMEMLLESLNDERLLAQIEASDLSKSRKRELKEKLGYDVKE